MAEKFWRFREFELDRGSFSLRRFGVPVKLDPKPLELLFLLAERSGAVVSHDEALERIWGEGVFVDGESALYTAVKKIRRALDDLELVQTISGRGYRLRVESMAAIAPAEKAADNERLAILPLANLSGDPAQDYFSDGLTEELIATLAKLLHGRMGVIARTSVMRFKTVSRPIQVIAHELGVNYLIEGSVRRQQNRVRISVQLLRAADGVSLCSETFERGTEDVFALQREIALAASSSIRAKLTGEIEATGTGLGLAPVQPEVHDLYLRGRYLWAQRTRPTIEAAIRLFREALSLDKGFAPAYAGLSCCYAILPITSNGSPAECFPQAQALATEAIALDASQTEAHIALGLVEFWYKRNWSEAVQYFRHAMVLNPSDSAGPMFLAHVHSVLGEHEQAQRTIADALRLDPLSPIVGTHVGHFLYNAGRFREAQGPLARVVEMNPQFWVAHLMQGKALASAGRSNAGLQAFARAQRFGMGNTEALSFRIHTLAAGGQMDRAQAGMREMEKLRATQPVSPIHRALARLGLGERKAALELLEEAFAARDVRLIFLGVEERWKAVGDSAYGELLGRAGLGGVVAG